MAYKIQHLRLGGILDQAIALTKDHFGLLLNPPSRACVNRNTYEGDFTNGANTFLAAFDGKSGVGRLARHARTSHVRRHPAGKHLLCGNGR